MTSRPARDVPAGRSLAHGFCDDDQTRRLLRSRPPKQALAWAGAHLGSEVTHARALRGGTSSAVHLLTAQDGSGHRRQAVLRRYVRPELNAEEPDIAQREALALHAAGRAGVPTPALLATDPTGTGAGVPASHHPPDWARYPRVWERAAQISFEPAPDVPAVLLHRDFHPGNVLWRRSTVSGVVDWLGACTGPAAADVAHCRVNLLGFGIEAVQRFTTWWQQAAGAAYHPWGDVVTVIGFLDDLRDGWGPGQYLVEDMLASAVAELGGNSR